MILYLPTFMNVLLQAELKLVVVVVVINVIRGILIPNKIE